MARQNKRQRAEQQRREAENRKRERLANPQPIPKHTTKPVSVSVPETPQPVLHQENSKPEVLAQKETSWEKFVRWLESPLVVSGGLAVILSAFAFIYNAPKASLIVLLIGWGLFVLSVFRHNFFQDKTHKEQKIRKLIISVLMGMVLFVFWIVLQPEPPQKERPFLVIGDAFLISPLNSGKFPVGKFKLKNTGKAPATNISSIGKTKLLTKEEVKLVQQGIMPQLEDRRFEPGGVGILGVGESFANSTIPGKDPEGEDKKALINGDYVFYMWIETIYTDLEGKKYFYKSCLYSESVDSTSFRICNKWNDSS